MNRKGSTLAKAEIKRMNDELELRVVQRTEELEAANRKLREAQAELPTSIG
jgi:hypothetical protein